MANTKVTTGVIKDDAVGADQLASNSVVTASIVDNAITTAKINNDAILTAKISNSAITNAKMSANSVDSDQYVDGSIDTAHIGDGQITSAKLDTNIAVSGELTVGSHLNMGDGDILKMGASADLQIYHDASGGHSRIDDTGTGGLVIRGSQILLEKYGGGYMLNAVQDGAVTLYYAGASKLATTSSGVNVTGAATMDGLTVDAASALLQSATGTASPTPTTFNIATTSSGSDWSGTNSWGRLAFYSNDGSGGGGKPHVVLDATASNAIGASSSFSVSTTSESANTLTKRLNISSGGDISFYNTAGTSQALFWDASAESLGIGTNSPNSTAGFTTVTLNNATSGGIIDFENNTSLVGRIYNTSTNFHVYNQTANSLLFGTGGTEKMRIDSSGNVGIGTTSPSANLHVNRNTNTANNVDSLGFDVAATIGNAATNPGNHFTSGLRLFQGSGTVGSGLGVFYLGADNGTAAATNDYTGQLYAPSGMTGGIKLNAADSSATIRFETAGSEAMRINSSGNVGIGSDNPSTGLHLYDRTLRIQKTAGDRKLEFIDNRTGANHFSIEHDTAQIYFYNVTTTESPLLIKNNGDITMTAGNVGIGTSSPVDKLQITTSGAGNPYIGFDHTGDNPYMEMQRWSGTASNYFGTRIKNIQGVIAFESTGSSPAAIGSQTFSESMRIDSLGNLMVGKTDTTVGNNGQILKPNGETFHTIASANNTLHVYSSTASAYRFYVSHAGQINATSTSINAISDKRLKENIVDLETGLSEVMALKPRRFDWKNGDGENVAGFIAQEVETVLPDLISDYKHEDLDDAKSVRMGDMLPTLVKAIQEQQEQIETLKAEIQELKG